MLRRFFSKPANWIIIGSFAAAGVLGVVLFASINQPLSGTTPSSASSEAAVPTYVSLAELKQGTKIDAPPQLNYLFTDEEMQQLRKDVSPYNCKTLDENDESVSDAERFRCGVTNLFMVDGSYDKFVPNGYAWQGNLTREGELVGVRLIKTSAP